MMSLFSSFDLFFFPLSLFIGVYFLFLLFSNTEKLNYMENFKNQTFSSLELFFLSLKQKNFSKFFVMTYLSMFTILFFLNASSIMPFNFSTTSQLSLILQISLTTWLSYLMFLSFMNMKGFLSHCIPEGTPLMLIWLLFVIELVSNIIRPVTLTVRLMANILAGHLLMILLSELALKSMLTVFLYMILNLVELVVSLIQAYIFVTMLTLYYSETN